MYCTYSTTYTGQSSAWVVCNSRNSRQNLQKGAPSNEQSPDNGPVWFQGLFHQHLTDDSLCWTASHQWQENSQWIWRPLIAPFSKKMLVRWRGMQQLQKGGDKLAIFCKKSGISLIYMATKDSMQLVIRCPVKLVWNSSAFIVCTRIHAYRYLYMYQFLQLYIR